ncbi:MAG TPA: sugar phosphate isomerase/epimerase family protein [Vicinamibacteria bacterium]|nr:sugar phosphate isomerase/epimerase family protein [Vicinamibacteria bacterium]
MDLDLDRLDRRHFLELFGAAAGLFLPASALSADEPLFRISLAQWSLHRSFFGDGLGQGFAQALATDSRSVLRGPLDPLDFPVIARRDYGIAAIEYVNTFFFDRARDETYLAELRRRASGEGVESLLIMCDAEGDLGDPDAQARSRTVENHHKWVGAAKFLGCHSIRVNARSAGSYDEQMKLAADGLRRLVEYGADQDVNVIVENHGGLSSNGAWLAGVMGLVDHPRVGTLPDFGNFRVSEEEQYDNYRGVRELMPWAKAVSAKAYDFDEAGNHTRFDFERLMRIVLDAGYRGYVGIEYEGDRLSEAEGIHATKRLLERVHETLKSSYASQAKVNP